MDIFNTRTPAILADMKDFFKNVLKQAMKMSGAEEGGVVLRNHRTRELRVEVFFGEGVNYKKRILDPNPQESICASSAESKQIHNIPDVNKDPRFHPLSKSKIVSEIVIPIIYEEYCDGLINLESTRLNAFPKELEMDLDSFANSISAKFHIVLIDYHRHFLERQLTAVRDVTEITLLHMDSPYLVIDRILNQSLNLTEADTGGILLMSNDRESLKLVASRGLKPEYDSFEIPRGEGFVWKCAQAKNPLNIWNVHEFDEIFRDLSAPTINSELVVPLSFQGMVFGVINIESSDYNAFSLEHEETLSMFAQQVALLFQLTLMRKRWEGAWAMARWGDLSQNVAHRMNNLIGGVNVLASRIERMSDNVAVQSYANQIRESTSEALNVVKEYRERFDLTKDYIDICSTIKEASLQIKIPNKNIKLSVNIPDKPIIVSAPERQIRELCRELIGNSLKNMGDKGEIIVKLTFKWDILTLEVSDSGPGFSSNEPNEFFAIGKRGATESVGTGYGLWWTQKFVHALGGEIVLQNRSSGGGVVTITLPLPSQDQEKGDLK